MARRVSVFNSSSSAAVVTGQTFEVTCSCGELLSGPRKTEAQTIACPECGRRLFVLPADSYAGALPRRARRSPVPRESGSSARVIDNLNRLALWTRLRESRTSLGGHLCSLASRAGRWLKMRFSAFRR